MAGVIPGLMLACLFVLYDLEWGKLTEHGGRICEPRATHSAKLSVITKLFPITALIIGVIGSNYTGIAVPTEAAVLGVVGALALAAFQRLLNLQILTETLMGTVKTTSMIILLLAGSAFLALAMGFTGLPHALAEWIAQMELSATALILALMVIYKHPWMLH